MLSVLPSFPGKERRAGGRERGMRVRGLWGREGGGSGPSQAHTLLASHQEAPFAFIFVIAQRVSLLPHPPPPSVWWVCGRTDEEYSRFTPPFKNLRHGWRICGNKCFIFPHLRGGGGVGARGREGGNGGGVGVHNRTIQKSMAGGSPP